MCTNTPCEDPSHYACHLRAKGLQVSPRVLQTSTQNWRPSVSVPPSHWKNIAMQDRPGGGKSPILKADGTLMRHKEYQEKKAVVDEQLKRIQTTTS